MLRSLFARAAKFPRPAYCGRRGLLTQAYSVGPNEACSELSELSDDVFVETDVTTAAVAREDSAAAL
jgi:hypothetical protein